MIPIQQKDVLKSERIAIKMVLDLENLAYEERLKEMQLSTLKKSRERGISLQYVNC